MEKGGELDGGWSRFVYACIMSSISPLLDLHLLYRRAQGREHHDRWSERLGHSSLARPSGPLLWFHAVSVGTIAHTEVHVSLTLMSFMSTP